MSHLRLVRPDESPAPLPEARPVPRVQCIDCGMRLFVAWWGETLTIQTDAAGSEGGR